jgi:hypothetical protein
MSNTALKFIQSLRPDISLAEAALDVARLETFLQFFSDIRAWRESLPPGQRIMPKPVKLKYEPYRIIE